MQGVGGWVEPDVYANRALSEAASKRGPIGGVVNKSTGVKVYKQVHIPMLPATARKAALNSVTLAMLADVHHALSLPPFGVLSDPSALVDVAIAAEERGWDGVFLWDHLLRPLEQATEIADPWIMLSAIAVATARVRIGPMVTPIARRRPLKLAREVATLDMVAHGRLTLCLGLGVDSGGELTKTDEELDPSVRGSMLDEGVVLLDQMLRGEHVTHRGEHFMVDGITLSPTGAQSPRVPFWMAARGANAKPVRRAARYEGLCPTVITPQRFSELVEIVATERSSTDDFVFAVMTTSEHRLSEYERRGANWAIHEAQPHYTMVEIMEIVNRMDA
jgi:alkanesulfonate monooxygenase SsuD/methylene tetrahydromethanopterin reductase-like flavin-dependent oxidoreductase (luciferase family)